MKDDGYPQDWETGMDGDEEDEVEAIAVVGMSGRFPMAPDLDSFWHNLAEGKECVSFFSKEEMLEAGLSPETFDAPNYVPARAVLEDAFDFDAGFFGMSPAECRHTDPQHRLFLESAWHALEHAGYDPARYKGMIGVYAGADVNGYALVNMIQAKDGLASIISNDKDFIATRTSFKLNLKGPSMTVQTACSTSLVAVQLACQGLLNYQSDMALAGGVGFAFPQKTGYLYQEGSILSPSGHCRPFDAAAKGTLGGDGVGVVVLKRYSDACKDGDHILAVIKGAALNNDGSNKVGYTAPSVEGQSEVIALAQAEAGVTPDTITYIETHGTGTALGDPVEISALTDVFRASTDKKQFCAIGSLKANLGHMSSAAGIGGLIKTILALQHKQIPPSINFDKPNPLIDFENSPFFVNTQLRPWESGHFPRRAGVSSFGIGGTNAHLILEESQDEPDAQEPLRAHQLLVLSAQSEEALDQLCDNMRAFLDDNPQVPFEDVAYTSQVGRALFSHRRFLVCRDAHQAAAGLRGRGQEFVREPKPCDLAFMFPGQGAQYVQMGKELYQTEPRYRETFDYCADFLEPLIGADLRQLIFVPEDGAEAASERLNQTAITQPALFAVEYALAKLWMEWGVMPDAMLGHSVGEYVAAVLAGVFTLDDGLRLIAKRGALIQSMPPGDMLAVPLPEEEARRFEGVSLAAVNAPSMVVLSGSAAAIAAVSQQLRARDIQFRPLHTSHAFHSDMIAPIAEDLRAFVAQLPRQAPQIPFISNVSGTWITEAEATSPDYWVKHCLMPVRFADGVRELLQAKDRVLLEVGPGSSLSSLVKRHSAEAGDRPVLPSMRHPRDTQSDQAFLLETLGSLYCHDVPVDWQAFYGDHQPRRTPLPLYPFQRETYTIDFQAQLAAQLPADNARQPHPWQWLYLPSWRTSLLPTGPVTSGGTCVLLCHERSPLHRSIRQGLLKQYDRVVSVYPGEAFVAESEDCIRLEPNAATSYEDLFERLKGAPVRAVVHLWDLDPEAEVPQSWHDFYPTQERGFFALMHLAKSLGRRAHPLRLEVVTNDMADVLGMEQLHPERIPLAGACQVISQEYPHILSRITDFSMSGNGGTFTRQVDQLLAELAQELPVPSRVAYRGNRRYIEGFQPVGQRPEPKLTARLRSEGCYLITGGLGGIGLSLAKYLAKNLQAKLVLTSRSGLPPRSEWEAWLNSHATTDRISRRILAVRDMEADGGQVMVAAADVADETRMREVVDEAGKRFGPINGCFHGAGILDVDLFHPLVDCKMDHLLVHYQPKIHGCFVLREVLPATCDFCVLLSSMVNVVGGVGFYAYAGANQFLPAFAAMCNGQDTVDFPWIAVDWDGWKVTFDSSEALTQAAAMSQFSMEPHEGVEVFLRVLDLPTTSRIVVSTSDIDARLADLSPLHAVDPSGPEPSKQHQHKHARPKLDTEFAAPRDEIESELVEIWQDLLGFEAVGIYDNFFKMGGDSLVAIQLSTRLRDRFHVELTVNNLFDEPNIAGLAVKLRELMDASRADHADLEDKLAMIENMSEEEVAQMLAELKQQTPS